MIVGEEGEGRASRSCGNRPSPGAAPVAAPSPLRALLALLAVLAALLLAGQAEARPQAHGPQAEASQSDDCGAASRTCVLHVLHCAAVPTVSTVQPARPTRVSPASPTAPRGLLPGRRDPPQPRPPLLSVA